MELDFGTCAAIALGLVILAILMTGRRKKEEIVEESTPAAPYKVETPVVPAVTETVVVAEVATEEPAKPVRKPRAAKVGATTAAKAKAADKKPAAKKPAAKTAPAKAKKSAK